MKWKKLLPLGLCLALMGCGQAGGQVADVREPEVSTAEGQARENDKEASVVREDEGRMETQNMDQAESSGEGSLQELEDGDGSGWSAVTLDNAYQRAAFFADQVYASNHKSILVSPLSLEMALGLAAEGASGETAQELYKYLGNENYADFAKDYLDFAKSLESSAEPDSADKDGWLFSSKYSFRYELANSIWVKKQNQLNEAYQKLVTEKFSAEAQNVDFVGEPQKTADLINGWCDEHTHGMIPKMVEPDLFSEELMAIIMNSVYFESPWVDKWGLTEREFTNFAGEKTTQEMLTDKLSCYYENEYATGFAKAYYNGFRFIGILPKEEGEFNIASLDLKSFLDSETYEYDVRAIAPKLNYETSTKSKEIVGILQRQGLSKVFDPTRAEFDGLVDGQEMHIDDIIQKCKLEMDEEGTRAAAVTAIMVKANGIAIEEEKKVKEVYLDRPFAFLIYDSINDQILFVGKVTEL